MYVSICILHMYVCNMYIRVSLDSKALETKVHPCEICFCICLVSKTVPCSYRWVLDKMFYE